MNNVALSAGVAVQAQYTQRQTVVGFNDNVDQDVIQPRLQFLNGTNSGRCDNVYRAFGSIAANTTVRLDLANGALYDPQNLALSMVRVKSYVVQLLSPAQDADRGTNCSAITLQGLNGTNGFFDGTTPKARIKNGGFSAAGDPSAGGCNTGLNIALANEDLVNAAAYKIMVFGGDA